MSGDDGRVSEGLVGIVKYSVLANEQARELVVAERHQVEARTEYVKAETALVREETRHLQLENDRREAALLKP